MSETNRYSRQIKLPEVGTSGQEKLRTAKVLIVGVGGLGCPAAQYLVAAGVGTLALMDHDMVNVSNLHRQVLFRETDLGKPKAEAAREVLQKQNSEAVIVAITHGLTIENAIATIRDYDLIIDGTDNFQSKYLINDACLLAGKPWVYASIYKYQGQLSVFNYENGPTYRCLFPKAPSKDISCEETGVLGVIAGVLGTLQATEAMKILLQIGQVLTGKLKLVDTLTMQDQLISFDRNEDQVQVIKNRKLQVEAMPCEIHQSDQWYLDVREPFESPKPVAKNILHIPLNELKKRHAEIPLNKEVYVFCQSGIRSQQAIYLLSEEFGFKNLINVKGGIQALLK